MTDPIDRAPFYHDGMRELQDRFDGRRVADGLEKHRLHFEFWEQDRKLIEETRFLFHRDELSGQHRLFHAFGRSRFRQDHRARHARVPRVRRQQHVPHTRQYSPQPERRAVCSCVSTARRFARASEAKQRSTTARERLPGNHGAKVVVRVKCEIFPNCPRYVPDLMGASAAVAANQSVPRPGV
jgi:hypothetical protein